MVRALERHIATPESKNFERWFEELRGPLYRYLRTAGCRHALAEEITQEAFLRLHNSLDAPLEIIDVRAWVFRVARNLWIDSRRFDDRYRRPSGDEEEITEWDFPATSPDPEQQAIDRQQRLQIAHQLSRLPELQRECLNLKARGLRYTEIAAILNISTTAAVDYVRRAVKKLGKLFR